MKKTKKWFYLFYVVLVIILGFLQKNAIINIRDKVVWFFGIVTLIKLFTTVPFPHHSFSTVRSVERLSKEQQKHPTMSFLDFFFILIPLIIFLGLT